MLKAEWTLQMYLITWNAAINWNTRKAKKNKRTEAASAIVNYSPANAGNKSTQSRIHDALSQSVPNKQQRKEGDNTVQTVAYYFTKDMLPLRIVEKVSFNLQFTILTW